MNETCDTVMVKGADGQPLRINKDDYDADTHTLYKGGEDTAGEGSPLGLPVFAPAPGVILPPAPSAPNFGNPVPPSTASADTLVVSKEGTGAKTKYFVAFADGSKVTGYRDVNEAGYATEGEAWAAVLAVKQQPNEQSVAPPPNMPAAQEIPTP